MLPLLVIQAFPFGLRLGLLSLLVSDAAFHGLGADRAVLSRECSVRFTVGCLERAVELGPRLLVGGQVPDTG